MSYTPSNNTFERVPFDSVDSFPSFNPSLPHNTLYDQATPHRTQCCAENNDPTLGHVYTPCMQSQWIMSEYDLCATEASTRIRNDCGPGWVQENTSLVKPDRTVDTLWNDVEVAGLSDFPQWHLSPPIQGAPKDTLRAMSPVENTDTTRNSSRGRNGK